MTTMATTEEQVFHIAFAQCPRVMLMDKSTPIAAITGTITGMSNDDPANMIIKAKVLFPVNGGPVKAGVTLIVNRAHVVSMMVVQAP
jgi:hypothetical protein